MATTEELEQQIEELRARLDAVSKGGELKMKSHGFHIGNLRIFQREITSGDDRLYQEEPDGTQTDLTTAGSGGTRIQDADADTKVQTEKTADDDTWRVDCAGNEELKCTDTQFTCTPNADFSGGADVTGNITVTGTVDGVDIAARDHAEAHGPAQHTAGNAWKIVYQDAAGDETEIAVGADGTVLTGQGAAAAPAFQAASEHAHANDHAEAHSVASHNDTTATGAELETLTDGSTAGGLHVHVEAEITDLDHLTGAEAIAAVEGEATLDLAGDVTIAATKSLTLEKIEIEDTDDTPIDDVLLKVLNAVLNVKTDADDAYLGIKCLNVITDNIQELTGAAGVTIDGVTLKDDAVESDAIRGLKESGGQVMAMGAVADGQFLKRDGAGVVGAAGGGGGATVALDNLDTVAINESLISDTDSTDDLGSSSIYWANAYIDKVYLNATATLDGATAGKVSATGHLQVSGNLAVAGASVEAPFYINAAPTGLWFSGNIWSVRAGASGTLTSNAASIFGVWGAPAIYLWDGVTGANIYGLMFIPAVAVQGASGTAANLQGLNVGVCGCALTSGTLTIPDSYGAKIDIPNLLKSGTGAFNWTDNTGLSIANQGNADIANAYGLRVADVTASTTINCIAWFGDASPQLRIDGGAYAVADKTASVFLIDGVQYRLIKNGDAAEWEAI